jgi:hypothetical protein
MRWCGRFAVVAVLAAGAGSALPSATAFAGPAPEAVTRPATEVGPSGATLHGMVTPIAGRDTSYFFVYGTTRHPGRTALASAGDGAAPVAVSARVEGLDPATSYAARLVAFARSRLVVGDVVNFVTPAIPPPPPPPPVAPSPAPAAPPPATQPVPPPVLGKSVNVSVRSGSVSVKLPGTRAYAALTELASIPVGSLIDARNGSVTLRSARPGGGTQTGTFHGGLFEVRQPKRPRGMIELVLRGAMPSCGRAGSAAASARKPPRRRLWGRTARGRFRTRGGSSVTTVRGTSWLVSDRCAGTVTRVRRGSVTVHDLRRHRKVIVRAGQRYIARRP